MKALIARWLPHRFYSLLPGRLRWRLNYWLHPEEVRLFQLLYMVNHMEERWPQMVPQIAYFDADQRVLQIGAADWEPATTEVNPPALTKYTTFYVDWPDGQTILIADDTGKVSRLMANEVMGTCVMEIGIHDGEYVDSLGNFVSVSHVSHGPAQEP